MRVIAILLVLFIATPAYPWGKTGHRVVGYIAQQYLSGKTKRALRKIMVHESLASSSNWMDLIRSDPAWDHAAPWHYATVPDGLTWPDAGIPEDGDIIQTLERVIQELKSKNFTDEDEVVAIRLLVHLVGDLHQPLHIGNGEDRGGNSIRVKWFSQSSNLHRVWDSQMIDYQQLSYTELAQDVAHLTREEIFGYLKGSVEDWAYESMTYRNRIYDLPEGGKLGYQYVYDNWDIVEKRLLQAGVRLAGILNAIYG